MSVWANNMVGYVAALCLSICMIFYCRGYKLPFIREACILKSGDRGGSSMKEGIFSNKEVHPGDNKTSSHILWTEVQASANLMVSNSITVNYSETFHLLQQKSKGVDVLRDSANNCGQLLQKNLQAMHPSIPIIVYVEDDTLECGHPHVDLFINFKGDLSQNDLQIALDSTARTAQGVESLELLG
eukprot:CAMPEP_0114513428 /NCGR_PEP_ID=MMETSP0109-20121206/15562_1 /TAXON_ID=29199 /ORGANISM="Chlorarachnion reptans, Strain CCCM449" /LENGTH=184 /DNA_ID=CAMNT_0001693295 /DNA_START=394 /DNA_END=948 /DNA_ORIENTATION=+